MYIKQSKSRIVIIILVINLFSISSTTIKTAFKIIIGAKSSAQLYFQTNLTDISKRSV